MPQKPNILFLMPDQLRADFLGCYGADFIQTPNIDSLAQKGVRYANACSPSPICVPARSVLLTGINAIRTGVLGNNNFLRPDLSACGMHTWPEHLNNAGYTTAAIGKMHFYPWELSMGFQHRIICEDKRWIHIQDDYHHHLQKHGLKKFHGNEHDGYQENRGAIVSRLPYEHSWDYFVGEEATQYIRKHDQQKPFAMMVGFPGPHCPYDPSPGFENTYNPNDMPDPIPESPDQPAHFRDGNVKGNISAWNGVDYTEFNTAHKKKIRAHYAGLVQQIDNKIGDILAALKETGQLDNTIIIFSSDHGDYLGDHGLIGKGTFYEASIKVPLIVHVPWATEGKVYHGPISIEDITATILHFGGCDIPKYFDAIPLPELGIEGAKIRDRVYGFLANGCMNYDGEWKLSKYTTGTVQLFNIQEDPGEQENCIDDPECWHIFRRLDTELTTQMLKSITASHAEKAVQTSWEDMDFARGGWQRKYPQPIE